MKEFISFVIERRHQIASLAAEHMELTAAAVIISILIGVPLGIFITNHSKTAKVVINFANLVQAIPSLALLGFAISFLGIGMLPAVFMITLYSLLPIIKNTYTGVMNINPQMIESARGIGMSSRQILFMVKVPLALPVIMAGVRISAVTAIGLVTIAALVGAGGLGYLVFSGIQSVNNYMIIAGAVPACILALLVDYLLGRVELLVTPLNMRNIYVSAEDLRRRKAMQKAVFAGAVAVLVAVVAVASGRALVESRQKSITIASKDYTEQQILGNIFSELVEAHTGIKVNRQMSLGGSNMVFTAMKEGLVDMYVEYTGTAYINILKLPNNTNPDEVYKTSKDEFKKLYGIEWLAPLGFNNTYTIAVRKETAEKYNLAKISDLRLHAPGLTFTPTVEFANRPDGLTALEKLYGLQFKAIYPMEAALRYKAISTDSSQVVDAFSTDGLLKEYGLVVLEDDRFLFPPYYAAPVVREETLEKYPELRDVLNMLAGKIDEETMIGLNYQVDVEGKDYRDVAVGFLKSLGLM